MFGVLLSSSCEYATKEAKKISDVCYKILSEVPKRTEMAEIREELMMLAEQSSLRSPSFSAAGFFNVDHGMLFTILGSFASYIVVMIQFNKE